MDLMGNEKEYKEQLLGALKERINEDITILEDKDKLVGKWNAVFAGYMDMPDEPLGTMEFFSNGKWTDGKENTNVGYDIPEKGILVQQHQYGEIPEADDPGGICEEGYYVFTTESGGILLSNSDGGLVIKLTKS